MPRSWFGCNDACPFKLRAVGSEMLRDMVMTNTTEVVGAVDLAVSVPFAVTTSHPGVVNSIAVIKGFFRWSMRVGGRGYNGGFRIFLFNERSRRGCVRSG
jgi:hypothetical protein